MKDETLTTEMTQAFSVWWRELTKKGDPLHIANKFSVAFRAGWEAHGTTYGEVQRTAASADINKTPFKQAHISEIAHWPEGE
jgi:hypothetical protein